ncbi:MAG: hypothetical protein J7L31_04065 [Thermoplasmata archaeon]|nr:hypothetical protein [Thermoplasmata archaeon]
MKQKILTIIMIAIIITVSQDSSIADISSHGHIEVEYENGERCILPFTIHFPITFPVLSVELVDQNNSDVKTENNMVLEYYKQEINVNKNGDILVKTQVKLYFEKFYRINETTNISGIIVNNYSSAPIKVGSLKIKNNIIKVRNCILQSKKIKEIKKIYP